MVKEKRVVASAFAKVNLHLWVGEPRADGFHSIVSIFQLIDLHDSLIVSAQRGAKCNIRVDRMEGIAPKSNTINRAARLFCEYVESTASLEISCIKRIPMQAGLGGGSSDAATVLRVLNELHDNPLEVSELVSLGVEIGSDVPFFLGGLSTALVEGRGEHMRFLPSREGLVGLLVMPNGEGVSTAEAFRALDALRTTPSPSPSREALATMYAGAVQDWSFTNDFRTVMGERALFYDALEKIVSAEEKSFGTVSGSGSCYCIISEDKAVLNRLRLKIEEKWDDIWVSAIKCLHRGHSDGTVLL